MIGWFFAIVLLPVALTEFGETSPWLARRCIGWAASRLPGESMRQRYLEEWCADLERVPGKITKLGYAVGLLAVVVPQLRWQAKAAEREVPGMRAACERAIASLQLADESAQTFQEVADLATQSLGFREVALNVSTDNQLLTCVATSGDEEMSEILVGSTLGRAAYESRLAHAESWGRLRFIKSLGATKDVPTYTPSAEKVPDRTDTWKVEYALLAPLVSPCGELMGFLSLDTPLSGCIPGPVQLELVEAYSNQLAKAIYDVRNR